jgi:hypothetical protein
MSHFSASRKLSVAADDPETLAHVGAFLQKLQELGRIDGRKVRIEYRWGSGDAGRISRSEQTAKGASS